MKTFTTWFSKLPAALQRSLRTFGQVLAGGIAAAVLSTALHPSFIGAGKAVVDMGDKIAGIALLSAATSYVQNKKSPITPETEGK